MDKHRKNKIGARCLTEKEAVLILPTYNKIFEQIEQFRRELEYPGCENGQRQVLNNIDQKTNNIGIIGVRGAGKTSVLKTIRNRLETENDNDIILPIIIPENMSESSTLMATILGMLSDIVTKKAKQEKEQNTGCYIKKSPIQQQYDETVKQYTFIQKEYRDILIHEYTSENDYVKSSTKVFNSDTEFINKFNELINELTNVQQGKKNLLFLFIDDIDLSAYRCTDVVKTLLSYLSIPNIVTFISGDIETFEESLVLDFLRQEKALEKGVFNTSVQINETNGKTVLQGKKQLVYEYLKKILPPVYRHNIKYWTLAEKGNYLVSSSENGQDNGDESQTTLSDLLFNALKGWVDPAFFRYAELNNTKSKENENSEQMSSYNIENLPYTYHLFDNTSRGLNNVYNILNDIDAKRNQSFNIEKQDKDFFLNEKKLLIDTIISSKPIYNHYRDKIQKRIFSLGATLKSSNVLFDNANAIIYGTGLSETGKEEKISGNNYTITNASERFSLFLLVDFVTRLLYEDEYLSKTENNENYKKMKQNAMRDLFFYPDIAEKVMDISSYEWENKDKIIYVKNIYSLKPSDINLSFLTEGDFVLNLAYYKNISLDQTLKLYEKGNSIDHQHNKESINLIQDIVIAFWKAVCSLAQLNNIETMKSDDNNKIPKNLIKYYPVFWKEIVFCQNKLSSSSSQNVVMKLFNDFISKTVNEEAIIRISINTVAELLKLDFDEKKEYQIDIKSLDVTNYNEKDQVIIITILKQIYINKLWKEEAILNVVYYLEKKVSSFIKVITNNTYEQKLYIDISGSYDSFKLFLKSGHGSTGTKFFAAKENICNSLCKESENTQNKQGQNIDISIRGKIYSLNIGDISYNSYKEIVNELKQLAENNKVWYGQYESQKLLNSLQESCIRIFEDRIPDYEYNIFLLKCYYNYLISYENMDDIVECATLLSEITKNLSSSHKYADEQTLDKFINKLNYNLPKDKQIDNETFNKLFSLN